MPLHRRQCPPAHGQRREARRATKHRHPSPAAAIVSVHALEPRLTTSHSFSAFHIEAALIVGAKYPELFWPYLIAQFDTQEQFWNQPVMDMTPSQCRDRLTDLAMGLLEKEGILGSGPKSQVYGQLREAMQNKGTPNGGNDATDALKYNGTSASKCGLRKA